MNNDYLQHHGIKGQKWGVRRKNTGYHSTSIRSAIARKQNEKVDAGFKKWNENAKKRSDAIELGKTRNVARMDYEHSGSKESRTAYRQADKAYKQALRGNTTYRKGQIKKEVGSDLSRKYLSDAKKIQKQMNANPGDKNLHRQYTKAMNKHDVERAKARRAPEIAANRSAKKAALKRSGKMAVKAAVTTAAVTTGLAIANGYLDNHNVTFNGRQVNIKPEHVAKVQKVINKGKKMAKYFY